METLTSKRLLNGLRKISPAFSFYGNQSNCWTPTTHLKAYGLYYNLEDYDRGNFICGVVDSMKPYDLVTPTGRTLQPGWKGVLWKVVKFGFANKWAVESIFDISLPEERNVTLPMVWECGCEFKEVGACIHGTQRKSDSTLEEELGRIPGVLDDRFYPNENATG